MGVFPSCVSDSSAHSSHHRDTQRQYQSQPQLQQPSRQYQPQQPPQIYQQPQQLQYQQPQQSLPQSQQFQSQQFQSQQFQPQQFQPQQFQPQQFQSQQIKQSQLSFGQTLQTCNQQTAHLMAGAIEPKMHIGGYNAQNLQIAPIPFANIEQVNQLRQNVIQKTIIHKTLLEPPNPPQNFNEPAINNLVTSKVWQLLQANEFHSFFNQETLQNVVARACLHNYPLFMQNWSIPTIDMVTDISCLALYDIALLVDDSSSMGTTEEDNLTRWQIAKEITKSIANWAILMDDNGISIDFFNSSTRADNVTDPNVITQLFSEVQPYGGTPMGPAIHQKILQRMVYHKTLMKPLLLIIITDGEPSNHNEVVQAIQGYYNGAVHKRAVSFSFAQVGSDVRATTWLNSLDRDPNIGGIIDVTSSFPIEKMQCEKAAPGTIFTPARWLLKTLLGGISSAYDGMDETRGRSAAAYWENSPPRY